MAELLVCVNVACSYMIDCLELKCWNSRREAIETVKSTEACSGLASEYVKIFRRFDSPSW